MRALVLDGDSRAALSIVRSLGKHGVYVIVASEDENSLAGYSRWCSEKVIYPCPRATPKLFQGWLISILATMPDAVLYTASDVTTSIAGKCRLSLPAAARTLLPPQRSLEITLDKSSTLDLAHNLDIPVPQSVEFHSGELVDVGRASFLYPMAIKSSQSDTPYRFSTAYASNPNELRLVLKEMLKESPSALVQEVIPGEGTAIFALCDSGKPVVTFAHRRLMEKPPWGGVSVLSQSIDPPPDTLNHALRLLTELRWHGVAMVEFKRNAHGVPCLMEINPRFWGSVELAVRSGADFPYLAFQLASGEAIEPPRTRCAVNRWVLGEVDSATTALTSGVPGQLRVINFLSHFWGLRHGLCCEVERLSDLRPAVYEHATWLRASAKRVSSRLKGDPLGCEKLTAPRG